MTYTLTIEPIGRSIEVEDGQTILDASLRAGIFLPHACGQGYCGTCKVKVEEGMVEHGQASSFALMDYEREEGMCLACCATLEDDCTIEADIEIEPDAKDFPVRDFLVTVVRVEQLTPTIKGIWCQLPEGQTFEFQAGQYINLHLPNGIGVRAFSLANPPSEDRIMELNIRIVPGGVGTKWIHESLTVGQTITMSGPYGRFFVRKSAPQPLLFMAGGSGLSSPYSMIQDWLAENDGRSVTLIYGARNLGELYYHDRFLKMAEEYPYFHYVPALSDADVADWQGFKGFVHDAAKEHFQGDFRNHKAYLCGPPVMIEACIATLMQGRLFEKDIYTENFFSAADSQRIHSPLFKRL